MTHGEARRGMKTSLYNRWVVMRQRCLNPNSKDYEYYGGRGISICDEWSEYQRFSEWAHKNGFSENMTLDRINNDGGYSPENCRWVSQAVNEQNRRLFKNSRTGMQGVSYSEKKKCYIAYINRYGKRLNLGSYSTIEEAKIARKSAEKGYNFASDILSGGIVILQDKSVPMSK